MDDNNTAPASDNGAPLAGTPPQAPAQAPAPGSVPYARFQEVVEQRKGLEGTLNALIDGMVNELPEDMRDLVPNLPPAEKAAWIRNAKERGIFSAPQPPANSPDAKRPGGKQPTDFSNLTPLQKMQMGYGK